MKVDRGQKKANEIHLPAMLILDKSLAKFQLHAKIEEIFHEI